MQDSPKRTSLRIFGGARRMSFGLGSMVENVDALVLGGLQRVSFLIFTGPATSGPAERPRARLKLSESRTCLHMLPADGGVPVDLPVASSHEFERVILLQLAGSSLHL